jgi:hypothetical protein
MLYDYLFLQYEKNHQCFPIFCSIIYKIVTSIKKREDFRHTHKNTPHNTPLFQADKLQAQMIKDSRNESETTTPMTGMTPMSGTPTR